MAGHVVTGPAVVLATQDGSERYLYRGALIGEGFTEESIKLAVENKLIEKVKSAVPDGDPSDKWKVADIEAYAASKGIDLAGASSKDEKFALITAPPAGA